MQDLDSLRHVSRNGPSELYQVVVGPRPHPPTQPVAACQPLWEEGTAVGRAALPTKATPRPGTVSSWESGVHVRSRSRCYLALTSRALVQTGGRATPGRAVLLVTREDIIGSGTPCKMSGTHSSDFWSF